MTRSVLLAIVLAAPGGHAAAGPDPPEAVDATLTVRLPAGRSTFAMGEIVPLDLEFRGRAGPDWYFSTASYDRSGRMGHERYLVTPAEGHDDPLEEYYASVGVIGGGLSSWHPLDGTPFVLRVRLNEWVRFTRPGEYRLVVESQRLGRYSRQAAPAVRSSPVPLRIEAARPEWAAAELDRAVAGVEGRGPVSPSEAAAILRHLGTREAALAMVRLHGTGGPRLRFDWSAGLAASPHRAVIAKAMEARVDAGEPLPAGFVRDLALLRSMLDRPAGSYAERFEVQKTAECDYARRSVDALSRRKPSVADLSAALRALEEPPDPACASSLSPLLAADPAASREAFLALPAPTQALLLEHRWTSIRGPWTRPALEALYAGWRGDSRFPGAGDAALRRLVEVAPTKGRPLALEEICTGARGLAPDTLVSLVEGPVPGIDEALRARCASSGSEEGRAAAMWLIARYGSPRLLPLVLGEIDQGASCDLEAAAIAYLLDHLPPAARHRLQPGFDRRRPGTCGSPPWWPLALRRWDETLETAAVAHLQGREAALVADAARVLGAHGSPRAKGPLLERFAAWREQWRGREGELEALASGPWPTDSPLVLENSLANALLEGRSFALTDAELSRVRDLCVTRGCRDNVDARRRARSGGR